MRRKKANGRDPHGSPHRAKAAPGAPVAVVKAPLLRPAGWRVRDVGRYVEVFVEGLGGFTVDCEGALDFAAAVRAHAKAAKANSGDDSRRFRVVGVLDGLRL